MFVEPAGTHDSAKCPVRNGLDQARSPVGSRRTACATEQPSFADEVEFMTVGDGHPTSDVLTEQQIADGYDAIAEHCFESGSMYTDSLGLVKNVHGRVLDVGCGQGRFLKELQRRHPGISELAGCDISPRLCEIARAAVPSATITVANALSLEPYESGHFDYVFMIASLEHMIDHAAALSAAHRVLKARGVLVVAVPNREWLRYDRYMSLREAYQPVDDHFFRPAELFELCRSQGFEIEAVRGVWAIFRGNWIHRLENIAALLVPPLNYKMKCIGVRCRKTSAA